MAVPLETSRKSKKLTKPIPQTQKRRVLQKAEKPPSWGVGLRNFFSCKYHQTAKEEEEEKKKKKKKKKVERKCNMRENSRVMQRPEPNSPESNKTSPLSDIRGGLTTSHSSLSHSSLSSSVTAATASSSSSSSSSLGGSFRGMHIRKFSGCYECRMVVDPITGISRVPSLRRTNVFACSDCEEIFTKSETLELHKANKHAVLEIDREDDSRNVVEMIFQSSWLKPAPVCKIDRILKVHNSQKTLTRYESYRDSVKSKANKLAKKHARCIADGNELLRYHCTSINCLLGLNGSTNLCLSISDCGVCSIIRDGFKPDADGKIRTMSTSGRAHDVAEVSSDGKERAMLVCRVIAGRVNKNQEGLEEYDSVSYSNLDELVVSDPKAILPCFVVIYRGF